MTVTPEHKSIAIVFLGTIAAYIWKHSRWPRSIDNHAAFMSHPFNYFGFNIQKYMLTPGSSLSAYFFSILFNQTPLRFARFVLDIIFVGCGILFFVFMRLMDIPPMNAALSTLLFYAMCFVPGTYHIQVEPEWPARLLSLAGMCLSVFGLDDGSSLIFMIGCLVSGTAFFFKLSVLLPFWAPVYALITNSYTIGFISLILIVFIFVCSHQSPRFAGNTMHQGLFFDSPRQARGFRWWISWFFGDMKRYCSAGFLNAIYAFIKPLSIHWSTLSAFIILFLLYITNESFSLEDRLAWSILFILPCLSSMIRLRYNSFLSLMIALPLSCASVSELRTLSHGSESLFYILYIAALSTLLMSEFIRPAIEKSYTKFYKLGNDAKKYLETRVFEDDYIFQNGVHMDIYHGLNCCKPPHELWWADRLHLSLQDENKLESVISFFRDKKPKYYIGVAPTLNLTAIERAAGLRYELEDATGYSIYRLKECQKPEGLKDVQELFRFDTARSIRDKEAFNLGSKIRDAISAMHEDIGESGYYLAPSGPAATMAARQLATSGQAPHAILNLPDSHLSKDIHGAKLILWGPGSRILAKGLESSGIPVKILICQLED